MDRSVTAADSTPRHFSLVATHGAAGETLGAFGVELERRGNTVTLFAEGNLARRLSERGIRVHSTFCFNPLAPVRVSDEESAQAIVEEAATLGSVIVTDLGSRFSLLVHQAAAKMKDRLFSCVYYHQRDTFVPGGYSDVAGEVISYADGVFFANRRHALEDGPLYHRNGDVVIELEGKVLIPIGYYDRTRVEAVDQIRTEYDRIIADQRASVLGTIETGKEDIGQRIWVYCGAEGTEKDYSQEAFPHFLDLVRGLLEQGKDLSYEVIVLQQHPPAYLQNETDRRLFEAFAKEIEESEHKKRAPQFVVSRWPIENMLGVAHVALYYRTAMAPDFAFAKIPHIIQVAHTVVSDPLTRADACDVVTDITSFGVAFQKIMDEFVIEVDTDRLREEMGISDDALGLIADAFETVSRMHERRISEAEEVSVGSAAHSDGDVEEGADPTDDEADLPVVGAAAPADEADLPVVGVAAPAAALDSHILGTLT